MSKFTSLLAALALLVTMTPVSFAHPVSSSSSGFDQALKIKSAEVETDRQRVVGEVEICNREYEDVRFILDVKNETINSLYKRRLSIRGGECQTVRLDFTKNFAEMSNTGDKITFVAKSVRGLLSYGKYALSAPYTATVTEGNDDPAECGDASGDDQIYSVCIDDFIYHEPSGLRIKVIANDYNRVTVLVTHVRWGGVKKFNVYKNRSKEVVSGDENHTKVTMSNLVGESRGAFLFGLESA
jgi:hypothetical protein